MANKNEYLLLAKNVTTIINDINSVNGMVTELTKNFNKGLNGDFFKKDTLTKIGVDLTTIKTNLNDKVLPELKKKSV